MRLKAIALGFDRHTESLKKQVELQDLGVEEMRALFNLDNDDPVIGASFPVERTEVRAKLQEHTSERLDSNVDWFAEIVAR